MADNLRKEIEKELKSLQNKVATFSNVVDIVKTAQDVAGKSSEILDSVYSTHLDFFERSSNQLTELFIEQETLFSNLSSASSGLTTIASKIEKDDLPGKVSSISEDVKKLNKSIADINKTLSGQKKVIQEYLDTIILFIEKQITDVRNSQSSNYQDTLSKLNRLSNEYQTINAKLDSLSNDVTNTKNNVNNTIEKSYKLTISKLDGFATEQRQKNQNILTEMDKKNKIIITLFVVLIIQSGIALLSLFGIF